MDRICVKYEVYNVNGNNCLNYSKELEEIINNLKMCHNSIDNGWISKNKDLFFDKYDKHINNMQIDFKMMKEYGNMILKIKDNVRQLDEDFSQKYDNAIQEIENIIPTETQEGL